MQEVLQSVSVRGEIQPVFFSPMATWRDIFRKRFDELKKARNLTQEKLAEKVGVSQGTIGHWLNGRRAPDGLDTFYKLAIALGLRKDALVVEIPEERLALLPPENYSPVKISTNETIPGYIRLQLLEGAIAAGNVGYMSEYPEVVQFIDVAEWWAYQNLGRIPAARLRIMTARGNSMQPDIHNGDLLFVDIGVSTFVGDGVYVIFYNEIPKVKRLQLLRDGRIAITSTNKLYETEHAQPHEVQIAGMLLKAWTLREIG